MTRKINARLAVRLFGAAVFLNLFALAALGQTGSITGNVLDPAGAAVPTAAINARNVDNGAVFESGASNTGNFVIRVPAGNYELTVEAPGFKKYVRSNLQVQTATDTRQDVTLEVGANTEVINVTETTPLLKTESGEMSHIVETSRVNQLPIITIGSGQGIRDPLQQIVLLPGTSYTNGLAVVVNGMPANSQTIRIEGQDSTGNIWKISQQNSQAGLDAIQEVAIQTSNFAAEFGQAAGGYFNYTMKSGTNQYHGSGFDYLVNEGLNAGLPFTEAGLSNSQKTGQHIRNRLRRQDFGGTIGGPVVIPKIYDGTNKTFFFFNFEQYRTSTSTASSLTTVPTNAYRQGDFTTALCNSYTGGDLNGTGGNCTPFRPITVAATGQPAVDGLGNRLVQGQIYDPYSTQFVNGTTVRTPYVNNKMPLTAMDPVALSVQKLLPVANQPGDINNYVVPTYSNYIHTTNVSFKFDQNISSTDKISVYYSQINNVQPFKNGLPAQLGGAPTNNWNHTTRVTYDKTITPTLLFHIGVGWFQTSQPHIAPAFDQSTIGLKGYTANQIFPDIAGVNSLTQGGYGGTLGATFSAIAYEQKPTANTSLTWVRGNHTYKFGGEYTGEGYPTPSLWRANGNFTFAVDQTANPYQQIGGLSSANPTGFGYASFLTGLPNSLALNAPTNPRLGYHSMGFYAQDTWKVSRKFTLDYGLRYDFQTYMREQYGRMQDASFGTFDPKLGRNGAVIYGQSCGCQFSHNYPFSFGPRVGGAYQIDSKTVLRGGAGVQYDVAQAPNGFLYSAADYYQINPNGYGISPMQNTNNPAQNGLQGGNPYAAGNPFGNVPVVWPNLDQNKYPVYNNGLAAPGGTTPVIFFDNHNRPGRVFTWSLAIQREVVKNLVVEVAYVGNRGNFFPAPQMSQVGQNGLTPAMLAKEGIDISNANDRALLTQAVSSAAVQARFPQFGLVPVNGNLTVPSVYPGFPATQQLVQALRSTPQWGALNPQLGPPMGKTWYDSLQTKVTKRYSHGLTLDANFTWAHAMAIGSASDSTFFLGGQTVATDIYNFSNNKQLNQYVRPLSTVISFTYTTPRMDASNRSMKIASTVLKDWQIGAVLRYQSGQLIGMPSSLNNLVTQLGRGAGNFGLGGANFFNLTGAPQLTVDPNSKSFNPQYVQALNTAAYVDAPNGQWSTSAPFYNNFRWQRQPSESMNFGRNFRFGKDGRFNLFVRAEFQNIFNRHFYSMPSTANPLLPISQTPYNGIAINSSGFGSIATLNGAGAQPRAGQIVTRFTF